MLGKETPLPCTFRGKKTRRKVRPLNIGSTCPALLEVSGTGRNDWPVIPTPSRERTVAGTIHKSLLLAMSQQIQEAAAHPLRLP